MARESVTVTRTWRHAGGFALLVVCLFVALSVFSYDWRDVRLLHAPPNSPPCNLIGPVGAWSTYVMLVLIGVGVYAVPVWLLALGLILMLDRAPRVWPKVLWTVVLLLTVVSLLGLHPAAWEAVAGRLNILPYVTGVYGFVVTRGLLVRWLSPVGAGIVLWSLALVTFVMLVKTHNLLRGYEYAEGGWGRLVGMFRAILAARQAARQAAREAAREEEERREREEAERREAERLARVTEEPPTPPPYAETADDATDGNDTADPAASKQPSRKRRKRKRDSEYADPDRPYGDGSTPYVLPPIDLLDPVPTKGKNVKVDTETTSRILVDTLAEFKIDVRVTNVETGPVVTRYELLPAPGIRIERIAGLSNNLALSLKAHSVRVQAPVPGKGVVGVEVPNLTAKLVSVRQIMEGEIWQTSKARLPLILGQDVGGKDIIADLTSMPHLLIAGATGSGKSVCMNSVLTGLLMTRTPDQLRLMLVDPKIVEFSPYNHLPHLVVPVITDPKKVALGLRWAIKEMEKRYRMFSKAGVRNIEAFNTRPIVTQATLFDEPRDDEAEDDGDEIPAAVPYVVIVIDELADLMLADQAEIENCIARLAQLSRAVGIHMIIATQRPSVNVITGTIKANFPSRIAFQVAQKVDSRTILDGMGAEKLLGRGDMLFMPPGTSKLLRAQGSMIRDEEIRRVVTFIKDQVEPDYELEIKQRLEKTTASAQLEEGGGEDEDLLDKAVDIIRETRRASTSSLQRRLRIGYTRAARMMDVLEERGIVGPPRGSDPREILIDLDVGVPDAPSEASRPGDTNADAKEDEYEEEEAE